MPGQVTTATAPRQANQPVGSLPFPIASRKMTRLSFAVGATTLNAGAAIPLPPIQLPAVGYLRHINLEVTVTGTGGTTPAFTADAPWNVLQSVELKTAAGNDVIVPVTGYQLYLMNKWGTQFTPAPMSDNRSGKQYAATAPSAHFFLQVPFEVDAETGLGAIPALASNRSYQLLFYLAGVSTILTGAPSVTVAINGTAHYWSEPPAVAPGTNVPQQTEPQGLGTVAQWQYESAPLTPGDKWIKSNNVGNVLRTLIFVLRNASGARIDSNGWPALSELYLDNEPMLYLTNTEWEDWMAKLYTFNAASKDVALGLDTGVYVVPFHAMTGSAPGDAAGSRSQYLPTLDSSQLQLRGVWGSQASSLEMLTNSVIPPRGGGAVTIYSK